MYRLLFYSLEIVFKIKNNIDIVNIHKLIVLNFLLNVALVIFWCLFKTDFINN